MWLVVGLGNPGNRYTRTRHNVGFLVIDEFIDSHGLALKDRKNYRISRGSIEDEEIVLLEPLTYMNRSGSAVSKIMSKYNILPERVIVIHDDLDMETGKLKIRKRGSSGGHRGIESVIQHTGSQDFIRVKIGIGRDLSMLSEDYVLSKFRRDELPLIRDAVKNASDAIVAIVTEGVDRAMNKFNTRLSKGEEE